MSAESELLDILYVAYIVAKWDFNMNKTTFEQFVVAVEEGLEIRNDAA